MGSVCVISGDDDVARKKAARLAVAVLLGVPPDDDIEDDDRLDIISADTEDKPDVILSRFVDSAATPALFCVDSRVLWLRHFPDFDLFGRDGEPYASSAALLLDPPDLLDIVVDGPGLDQRKQFAKKLKASKAKIEVRNGIKRADRDFEAKMHEKIAGYCKETGRSIDPDAEQFLVDGVADPAGLSNELDKVCCYIGGSPVITLDACRAVVSVGTEALMWEYTGAVQQGAGAQAMKLLSRLASGGPEDIGLIYGLAREFARMAQVPLAMKRLGLSRVNANTFKNIPDDVIAKNKDNMLLGMHPFRAFKVCESAMRIRPDAMSRCLALLRDANVDAVTGRGGGATRILEKLTQDLVSAIR